MGIQTVYCNRCKAVLNQVTTTLHPGESHVASVCDDCADRQRQQTAELLAMPR